MADDFAPKYPFLLFAQILATYSYADDFLPLGPAFTRLVYFDFGRELISASRPLADISFSFQPRMISTARRQGKVENGAMLAPGGRAYDLQHGADARVFLAFR